MVEDSFFESLSQVCDLVKVVSDKVGVSMMAVHVHNLGWNDLETEFKQSAEWIRISSTPKLSTDQKLSLYGFYKQASQLITACFNIIAILFLGCLGE